MLISQTEGYFENPWYRFLDEPTFFEISMNKRYPVLKLDFRLPNKLVLFASMKAL